jgi:hypothetical protein
MGIAVLFGYSVMFAIANGIAVLVTVLLKDWNNKTYKYENFVLISTGAFLSTGLTFIVLYIITHNKIWRDWELFFMQMILSLSMPIALGLLVLTITKLILFKDERKNIKSKINRFGCGMLYGASLFPTCIIAYMVIPKIDNFIEWFTYQIINIFI